MKDFDRWFNESTPREESQSGQGQMTMDQINEYLRSLQASEAEENQQNEIIRQVLWWDLTVGSFGGILWWDGPNKYGPPEDDYHDRIPISWED